MGSYRPAGYSRRTFLKLDALNQIRVRDNGDGTIQIGSQRYVEIEPRLFQRADGRESYAAFEPGTTEDIGYLLFGGTPATRGFPGTKANRSMRDWRWE